MKDKMAKAINAEFSDDDDEEDNKSNWDDDEKVIFICFFFFSFFKNCLIYFVLKVILRFFNLQN